MDKIVKLQMVSKYNGHQAKANGSVDLNVITSYSEMVSAVQLLQLLNNDIKLAVKKGDSKPFNLGMFRLNAVNFDHDGVAKIRFNGLSSFIEVDNLNKLIPEDKEDLFILRCVSEVELEDDEEDEEEE